MGWDPPTLVGKQSSQGKEEEGVVVVLLLLLLLLLLGGLKSSLTLYYTLLPVYMQIPVGHNCKVAN